MGKRKTGKRPRQTRPRTAKKPDRRAVEAALAGIAHDIRTPLTGIVALAELLATSDLGARERDWANAIKSGADHLAALTNLIVDAVKADAAGLTLRREPFSPRRLAEAVAAALVARAGNKGVKVEIAIAADMPAMVAGDALRLRAALENLVDNAIKFTGEGAVDFTAAVKPGARKRLHLLFAVADTGIGIDARTLKNLFRPFTQASEAVARRYGGAGLGLAFVRRVAEAMGGSLAVTSKPGRGISFRLSVPVDRVDPAPPAEHRGKRAAARRALSILCAEDNPYARVVMNTILTELGHRVDFVEGGEAAVEATKRGSYDAVLMDVALSGIDGLEATRRIRALPGKAGKVPVIGVSGRSESRNEQAARAAGMNFYFIKPVSPGKLAQALASLAG
ncbi:MAG TPA: ATP-binding protein [Pseudolabrys sp.]|jgi:CheY-like chemotaxis protein/nitrogen-specific signal transduction histidine kinase